MHMYIVRTSVQKFFANDCIHLNLNARLVLLRGSDERNVAVGRTSKYVTTIFHLLRVIFTYIESKNLDLRNCCIYTHLAGRARWRDHLVLHMRRLPSLKHCSYSQLSTENMCNRTTGISCEKWICGDRAWSVAAIGYTKKPSSGFLHLFSERKLQEYFTPMYFLQLFLPF